MKKLLLASVSVITAAASISAMAADMRIPMKAAPAPAPAPAAFSWTGCYAGASVGWGWGRSRFTDHTPTNVIATNPTGTSVSVGTGLIDSFSSGATAHVDQSGVIFGGQVGCDYQFANTNIVLGVSGSAAGADINGTDRDPNSFNAVFFPFGGSGSSSGLITAKTDFLADVSGRLGVTWGQALFYGKGGIAWAHNKYTADTYSGFDSFIFPHITSTSAFTDNHTQTGALVGGGIEWAFLPNWTAFVEYDHYFFGTKTLNFTATGTGLFFTPLQMAAQVDVKQDIDTVKVGLNYRFGFH